jgi:signal transduction histidine kinase
LNRLVRAKILDPAFEQKFVAGFEAAFESFVGLIDLQRTEQEGTISRWTRLAPYGLGIPIVIGIVLLLFSRRTVMRGFVKPMQDVVTGTRELSGGKLDRSLPETGVSEVRELARGISRMAQDLEESREAVLANERQSALGGLVPVVAHNIRNPLAAIRANAQLLDGSEGTEELAETRQAIIDTVDRLERWVTALVSYLHPLAPRRRPVAAAALLGAACELLAVRIEEAGVRCERDAWDEQARIDADPDLLEQALYGLLNNAVEASSRGGRVRCGVERRGREVCMHISDEAGGLPFQPEPSGLAPGPSTKRFGTGLGIPIAYKICGAHGFRLDFLSEAGVGTRVEICAAASEDSDPDGPE